MTPANARRAFLIGAASAALWGRASPARAQCNPGDVLVGETATDWICRQATATDLPRCSTIGRSAAEIDRARSVLRTQMQTANRNTTANVAALEEWSAFLQEQGETARKNALGTAGGWMLSSVLARAQAAAQATRLLRTQEAGLLRREWGALTVRLSAMSPSVKAFVLGRINNAATLEQGISALATGWQSINAAYAVGSLSIESNWATKKAAAVTTLSLATRLAGAHPGVALFLTDVDAGENALYGWWSVLTARSLLQQFLAQADQLQTTQIAQANRYVLLSRAYQAITHNQTYCVN